MKNKFDQEVNLIGSIQKNIELKSWEGIPGLKSWEGNSSELSHRVQENMN